MDNKLQFRRQFILCKGLITQLEDWKCLRIGRYYLYAHPDLEVTVKEESSRMVIMLGYMLSFHPADNDYISMHGFGEIPNTSDQKEAEA